MNLPGEVRAIQELLNRHRPIPLAQLKTDDRIGPKTIVAIEEFQGRVVKMSKPDGRVDPNGRTLQLLNGQPLSPSTASRELELAVTTLNSEAVNFGSRFIRDGKVRAGYVEEVRRYSQQILAEVHSGRLSPGDAARQANEVRNEIMEAARLKSSDIGRAKAQALKQVGKSLGELQEHYATALYKRPFAQLAKQQKNTVYLEIVVASGRTNPKVSVGATRLTRVGKGLVFVSLGVSVYNIATAENTGQAVAKEGVTLGAGFAGAALGGAVAGLACGPGAPVCSTIGVFVGGALFALGSDVTFDWLAN
jgi:hypothetical protein